MKTFSAKPLEVKRDWYVVDGSDKVLGRLATEIAARLRGKHKPEFTPHVDTGDYIVVINADKIKLSAEKAGKKTYYRDTNTMPNWAGSCWYYMRYLDPTDTPAIRAACMKRPSRKCRPSTRAVPSKSL